MWPGRVRIEVTHERYAPSALERVLPASACETLPVRGAAALSGTVVDDQGRPVLGAVLSVSTREGLPVSLEAPQGTEIARAGELGITKGPVPRIPVHAPSEYAMGALAAQSDAQGSFRITGLTATPLVLSVARAGYAPTVLEVNGLAPHAEKQGLQVVLSRAGRVVGRITDPSGNGVSGVFVAARTMSGIEQSATSDASGEFVIPDVVGSLDVEALPSGSPKLTCRALVKPAEAARCDFGVGSAQFELTVHVVDERGFSLEGALVSAEHKATKRTVAQMSRSDGTALLSGLPKPPYELDVALRDYLSVRKLPVESAGGQLRVTLQAAARIRGTVLDALGRPVFGALVSTDEGEASTDTDTDGSFELQGVAPGALVVWARHPRAGEGSSVELRARPEAAVEGARIVLSGRYVPSADDARARAALLAANEAPVASESVGHADQRGSGAADRPGQAGRHRAFATRLTRGGERCGERGRCREGGHAPWRRARVCRPRAGDVGGAGARHAPRPAQCPGLAARHAW